MEEEPNSKRRESGGYVEEIFSCFIIPEWIGLQYDLGERTLS